MNNMCDQCPEPETYKRALIWVNIEEKFQQYADYCKQCWNYKLLEDAYHSAVALILAEVVE
jgi:hypothetical protein